MIVPSLYRVLPYIAYPKNFKISNFSKFFKNSPKKIKFCIGFQNKKKNNSNFLNFPKKIKIFIKYVYYQRHG